MMLQRSIGLLAIALCLVLSGCGEGPAGGHFYRVKDGFEYGYERALSQEMKAQGQVTAPLQMFRYLGERSGVTQVYTTQGLMRVVAECSSPCEVAKIYTFADRTFVAKEHMQLPKDALLRQVFLDAQSGRLEQWVAVESGATVRYWVDSKSNQLVVDPKLSR